MALALPARASVVFNEDDTRPVPTAYGVIHALGVRRRRPATLTNLMKIADVEAAVVLHPVLLQERERNVVAEEQLRRTKCMGGIPHCAIFFATPRPKLRPLRAFRSSQLP